ncbi:MAG: hypothetical protein LBU11_04950 [Zoogloeaceae bacterium]|jgi:hypothetical protein|nr:hypothetical protein [Zoogloeaceae bacterium]
MKNFSMDEKQAMDTARLIVWEMESESKEDMFRRSFPYLMMGIHEKNIFGLYLKAECRPDNSRRGRQSSNVIWRKTNFYEGRRISRDDLIKVLTMKIMEEGGGL